MDQRDKTNEPKYTTQAPIGGSDPGSDVPTGPKPSQKLKEQKISPTKFDKILDKCFKMYKEATAKTNPSNTFYIKRSCDMDFE